MNSREMAIYIFLCEVAWTTRTRVPTIFQTYFVNHPDPEIKKLCRKTFPTEAQHWEMARILSVEMAKNNVHDILPKLDFWGVSLILDFFNDTRLYKMTRRGNRIRAKDPRDLSAKEKTYLNSELVDFLHGTAQLS